MGGGGAPGSFNSKDLFGYFVFSFSEKVLNEKDFLNKEGVKKRSPLFVTDNRFSYFGGGIEDDHIPFLRKGKI